MNAFCIDDSLLPAHFSSFPFTLLTSSITIEPEHKLQDYSSIFWCIPPYTFSSSLAPPPIVSWRIRSVLFCSFRFNHKGSLTAGARDVQVIRYISGVQRNVLFQYIHRAPQRSFKDKRYRRLKMTVAVITWTYDVCHFLFIAKKHGSWWHSSGIYCSTFQYTAAAAGVPSLLLLLHLFQCFLFPRLVQDCIAAQLHDYGFHYIWSSIGCQKNGKKRNARKGLTMTSSSADKQVLIYQSDCRASISAQISSMSFPRDLTTRQIRRFRTSNN